MQLYPIKFKPILKEKIWGGKKLSTYLDKDISHLPNCGESWEISGVPGDVSVVANGFLEGNTLEELIEVYMGDLVGDRVYEKFGFEFPLLIKFIDASDVLSIQVHPDDDTARERHNAYGKTEMWYVIQADEGSELISGFNRKVDKETYIKYLDEKKLKDILNYEKVKEGDVFFIPSGRVHAIGAGIMLAEIQQTSDITYRIYDWDRVSENGQGRELHTDLAVDVIDYNFYDSYHTSYEKAKNTNVKLESCPYFTTNLLEFDSAKKKDYNLIDSFVIYVCLDGGFSIEYGGEENCQVKKGETVLLPADLKIIELLPQKSAKLLEVYIG
ncbi:MAG: class I mannose-6-phosphate isomerase [Bacteroidales bacterium]|nr:class I mannose-6-phosphate isomerase [Bacteroidales bacterium]MCF8457112.1 class I mannose-6-phosphate isomerase [Bacteroidales bacterium]